MPTTTDATARRKARREEQATVNIQLEDDIVIAVEDFMEGEAPRGVKNHVGSQILAVLENIERTRFVNPQALMTQPIALPAGSTASSPTSSGGDLQTALAQVAPIFGMIQTATAVETLRQLFSGFHKLSADEQSARLLAMTAIANGNTRVDEDGQLLLAKAYAELQAKYGPVEELAVALSGVPGADRGKLKRAALDAITKTVGTTATPTTTTGKDELDNANQVINDVKAHLRTVEFGIRRTQQVVIDYDKLSDATKKRIPKPALGK